MGHGFRDFLTRQEAAGDVLRITPEIDTISEMGAVIARCDDEKIGKGLLFERPKEFDMPVFANTIGSTYHRIAESYGVDEAHAVPGAAARMRSAMMHPVAPVHVGRDDAPCQQVVLTGDDIDLGILPILRLNPQDGSKSRDFKDGRFVCAVACSKPAEGAHNLSYHRFEITERDGGSVWIFRGTGDAKSMEEFWGAKIDDDPST